MLVFQADNAARCCRPTMTQQSDVLIDAVLLDDFAVMEHIELLRSVFTCEQHDRFFFCHQYGHTEIIHVVINDDPITESDECVATASTNRQVMLNKYKYDPKHTIYAQCGWGFVRKQGESFRS